MGGPLSGDSNDANVPAVKGTGTTGSGVYGVSHSGKGIEGYSGTGTAVAADSRKDSTAIYARGDRGTKIVSECVAGRISAHFWT